MSLLQAIFLGVLQGVTEFFPISSSGHLVLAEEFFGFQAPDLVAFNVFLHVATLFAVVLYFRKQLIDLARGLFVKDKEQLNLFWALVIGTIPAVIIGLSFKDIVEDTLSNGKSVLIAMFFTGIYFTLAEKFQTKHQEKQKITISKGLLIGISQAFALIPGISRSGSTLSTGLFFKLDREKSAEYSFLLAIPAIGGAGLLTVLDLLETGTRDIDWLIYGSGFLASLLSGYFAISFLMKLYKKHSLYGFAGYLLLLACLGTAVVNLG